MTANLIVPQVQVKWGSKDLTDSETSKVMGPLVYDVRVELAAQSQWPKGQMMWKIGRAHV